MRFENKVALVTGAATGIGAATALAFAAEGAQVALCDVNEAELNARLQEIEADGGTGLAVLADVSQPAEARRMAEEAVAAYGGIDYLVASAGIQTYGTVVDTDEDTWDRTLDVNAKGVYLAAKFCVPEMAKRGGGAIVTVASVQGLFSQPNVAAYAASKGAVIAMTRTMAIDHAGDNIRANSICPGSIDTPLLRFAAEYASPEDPEGAIKDWGRWFARPGKGGEAGGNGASRLVPLQRRRILHDRRGGRRRWRTDHSTLGPRQGGRGLIHELQGDRNCPGQIASCAGHRK